ARCFGLCAGAGLPPDRDLPLRSTLAPEAPRGASRWNSRPVHLADRESPMRLLRWTLAAVLLGCVAVLLAYRIKDPERRSLDDNARREAPGRFVRLPDGLTHYETAGPDSGPVVVLAAAFSVPAYISDSLYQRLADSGFRVIRFDYFGRGWSDRPNVTYDLDLFVRQLAGLL